MVEAEIDASTERFLQELARGDAAAAASVYDEDAILLPPTGEAVRGRKAIESFWQSGIEIGVRTIELEPHERGEAGLLVYEVGRYRMVMQAAEDQPTLEHGAYVVLHRQEPDGSWRRAVDTFNRAPSQGLGRASRGGKGGSKR
jgi:ketosteroid isomerase-like protein